MKFTPKPPPNLQSGPLLWWSRQRGLHVHHHHHRHYYLTIWWRVTTLAADTSQSVRSRATCASRNLKCENDFISAAIIWSSSFKTGFLSSSCFFFLCSGSVSKAIKKLPLNSGGAFFFCSLDDCARKIIQSQKLSNWACETDFGQWDRGLRTN